MKNKTALITAAATIGAVAYRASKGYGIFNRVRFSKEHRAFGDYLSTHYPDACHGSIFQTEDTFSTIVTLQNRKLLLSLTKTDDGVFVFSEAPLDLK